jgi:hypothetical protein
MIYADNITDYVKKEIDKWLKKTARKGPFYLWSSYRQTDQSVWHKEGMSRYFRYCSKAFADVEFVPTYEKNYRVYWVIWKENNSVKIGALQDRMYCRYGIATGGKIYYDVNTNNIKIWGDISPESEEYKIMKKWIEGNPPVDKPLFDVYTLKHLNH